MSLTRLIELAKRTGDRLIVHDPYSDRDIVIMNLDQYELLLDRVHDDDRDDTHEAPWDEPWKNPLHDDPWHSTGSILEDRYGSDRWSDDENDEDEDDEEDESPSFDASPELDEEISFAPAEADAAQAISPEVVPIQGVEQSQAPASDEPVFYEEPV